MRLSLAAATALAGVAALAACGDDRPAGPPDVSAEFAVGVDSLRLDEPERAYRVAIGYPRIEALAGAPLPDALRAANAAVADSVAALADRLRPEAPPPGRAPATAVAVTGGTDATFLADALLSVVVGVSAAAGASDPTTFALPLTVDLATGAPVGPADWFAAGTPWADTLAAEVGRRAARLLEARGDGPLFAPGIGPVRAGRADLSLSPEAVVVHLPAGQVSRGGPLRVEVPLRVMAPFARAGSVLARHPAL